MLKRWAAIATGLAITALGTPLAQAAQPEPWHLNFQPPASSVMERVVSFHDLLLYVIIFICLFVLALLAITCIRFRERSSAAPSRRSHNTLLEIVWTAVPVLILVIVAVPSFKLLYYMDVVPETEVTLRATGNQWYWTYQYPDHGSFEIVANMVPDADLQPGQPRLLQTDNVVVVPVDTNVRLQVTGADVLHSWAMPAFGIKVDAVPGRLNEGWFRVNSPGVYYGQCSELCGINHAFMPITVQAVSPEEFQQWLEQTQAAHDRTNGTAPSRLAAAPADEAVR